MSHKEVSWGRTQTINIVVGGLRYTLGFYLAYSSKKKFEYSKVQGIV